MCLKSRGRNFITAIGNQLRNKRQQFIRLRALEDERWAYVLRRGYHKASPGYDVERLWQADINKNLINEIVNCRSDPELATLTAAIQDLRGQLIVAHQGLVGGIIHREIRGAVGILGFDDLQAHGTFGLMTAINRFDVNRDLQFSTYATAWIRASLYRSIKQLGSTVRRAYWRKGLTDVISLETEVAENLTLGDTLTVPEIEGDEEWDHGISNERLLAAQSNLSSRLQVVIRERFYNGKTLKRIGEENGLSRERIRQLEKMALAALRGELGVG